VVAAIFIYVSLTLTLPCQSAADVLVEPDFKNLELNLEEALRLGMTYSPLLRISEARIAGALAKLQEARSGYWPKLGARVSYDIMSQDQKTEFSIPETIRETLARSKTFFDLDAQLANARSQRTTIENLLVAQGYVVNQLQAQEKSRTLDSPLLWGNGDQEINNVLSTSTTAGPIPGYSATLAATRTQIPQMISEDLLSRKHLEAMVTISAPLFTFGRLSHLCKAAKAEVERTRAEHNSNQQKVSFMITDAFYECLKARDIMESLRRVMDRAEAFGSQLSAYSATTDRVADYSLSSFRAFLARYRGMIKKSEMLYETRKDYLKAIMGVRDPLVTLRFVGGYREFRLLENFSLNNCISFALNNRPDLKVLERSNAAVEQRRKQIQSEYFPQIGMEGSYVYTRSYDDGWYSTVADKNEDNWGLSFGATLNIFDGFERSAKINGLSEELRELAARRSWLRQNIKSEVSEVYYDVFARLERKKSLDAALQEAGSATTSLVDGFASSRATVREAQELFNDEMSMAVELAEEKGGYFSAFAKLKMVLGYEGEGVASE
jgi:outer membrane protein TolC